MVAATSAVVVACGVDNAKFNEFTNWINNQETFVLYIGARDCPYCNAYENAKTREETKGLFQEILNDVWASEYNANAQENFKPEKYNNYGEKLKYNEVKYHEFTESSPSTLWELEWAKKMYDWLIDNMYELTKDYQSGNSENEWKEKIKAIIKKESPTFVLVRNGRLVSVQSGFSQETNSMSTDSYRNLIESFKEDFSIENYDSVWTNKINGLETRTLDFNEANLDKYAKDYN